MGDPLAKPVSSLVQNQCVLTASEALCESRVPETPTSATTIGFSAKLKFGAGIVWIAPVSIKSFDRVVRPQQRIALMFYLISL